MELIDPLKFGTLAKLEKDLGDKDLICLDIFPLIKGIQSVITFDKDKTISVFQKNELITDENNSLVAHINNNIEKWKNIVEQMSVDYDIDDNDGVISIYGNWTEKLNQFFVYFIKVDYRNESETVLVQHEEMGDYNLGYVGKFVHQRVTTTIGDLPYVFEELLNDNMWKLFTPRGFSGLILRSTDGNVYKVRKQRGEDKE